MTSPTERIIEVDVEQEMRESFLEYSYSVIYARALPDARDGLKPVQRRIVYQMGEMGLRADRGHVKSARVTGEVMGKLHPHGDGAIYDALVRMAQPFSMRIPLIDGHGNFGSLDDGPAAARYTEVRLTRAAEFLNQSLDEDVVEFVPNYDAQLLQPSVLPAAFPNLLANGASGIAVGMATNIPPHNLGELVSAIELLINNPNAELEEVMKLVPGPDFPGGGIMQDDSGIADAYRSGRGAIKVRARSTVESVAPRKLGIVITELPYLVGPERVIEKIKDGVSSKKLEGISNVVDLTDRENGLRLVIELKTGVDPDSVLQALYRSTPIEENFSVNAIALVDGRPEQLGLIELLKVFIRHRMEVIERRTRNRLDKRSARLHLLDGLRIAVLNIDEVIEVIRSSETSAQARSRLMSVFDLSELQSEHILELRLRRLTKFSVLEIETEADALRREIEQLAELLSSRFKREELLIAELKEVQDEIGTPRRTQIAGFTPVAPSTRKNSSVSELADDPVKVIVTAAGQIMRASVDANLSAVDATLTTTRSNLAFVLSDGRALRVHVADIPPGDVISADSTQVREFLGLQTGLQLAKVLPWSREDTIAIATSFGNLKRVSGLLPDKPEVSLIRLDEGETVVGAEYCRDESNLVLITSAANALRTPAVGVRATGLAAGSVAGIKIAAGSLVAFGVQTTPNSDGYLVTVANSEAALEGTDAGSLKVSSIADLPIQGRGGQGVRCHKLLKGEDRLYFAKLLDAPPTLQVGAKKTVALKSEIAKRDASGSKLNDFVIGIYSS